MSLSLRDIVHLEYGYFAIFLDFPLFFLLQNYHKILGPNNEIGKHDLVDSNITTHNFRGLSVMLNLRLFECHYHYPLTYVYNQNVIKFCNNFVSFAFVVSMDRKNILRKLLDTIHTFRIIRYQTSTVPLILYMLDIQ